MIFRSGFPKRHHGDGIETQSSPESVLTISLATESPPGPRRLRFPSFKFNCQRAKFEFREHKPARRRTVSFFRDNEAPTGKSRLGTTEFREFDALRGRRSSNARQRGSFKQHPGPGVNTRFKKSLLLPDRLPLTRKNVNCQELRSLETACWVWIIRPEVYLSPP